MTFKEWRAQALVQSRLAGDTGYIKVFDPSTQRSLSQVVRSQAHGIHLRGALPRLLWRLKDDA